MREKYRFKQASQEEVTLYCLVGEALCAVQHVEDALSHSIVIKKVKPELRNEADNLLNKNRSYTLGRAISIAKQECLLPLVLLQALDDFLSERNWLIHKSIAHNRREWDLNISREIILTRIKEITIQAHNLVGLISEEMMQFVEVEGFDMSWIRTEISKYYTE